MELFPLSIVTFHKEKVLNQPVRIRIAVISNKIAKKYSIIFLTLLFLIYIFIAAPNAGQGAIEMGQTIKATLEITNIEKYTSMPLSKKPAAAIVEIVHAFGFASWKIAPS